MRILHVTPYYLPAVRYGGPVHSVHGLASGTAALGHDVRVFTTDADGPDRLAVPVDAPVLLDGVRVRYFALGAGKRLFRAPAMRAALAQAMREVDLVHIHTVYLWPTLVAARAAARAGVPYVLAPRGMLVRDLVRARSRIVKTAWIALFERRTIARAAAVHVTSASEEESLRAFGLDLPPVFALPNGVDDPAAWTPAEVSEDVAAATARPGYLLYFGRIGWEKNLDSLIRAVASLRDVPLVIAGVDERGQAAGLRALIAELAVGDRVTIVGRKLVGADKEALFAAAGLFVLASLHENFGNTILEAMLRGVPVLAGTRVGAAEVVRAADCGRVCEVTPAALAEAIAAMRAEPAALAAWGERGRRAAERDFGWRSIAARAVDAYRTAIAGHTRRVISATSNLA